MFLKPTDPLRRPSGKLESAAAQHAVAEWQHHRTAVYLWVTTRSFAKFVLRGWM